MFPIRDLNPVSRQPVAVPALVAVNVAVFLYELSLGAQAEQFIFSYGLVPYHLLHTPTPQTVFALLSSMFLHGGVAHVFGNMWFLWVFGDNVEDRMGRANFLIFYLLCGLCAAGTQVALAPDSRVPMVGASGAIAGVLGAYARLFPRARVLTVIPIFIFLKFIEVPAFLFLLVWFGFQLLMSVGTASLATAEPGGGVAFFAHVGGFVAGALCCGWFTRGPRDSG